MTANLDRMWALIRQIQGRTAGARGKVEGSTGAVLRGSGFDSARTGAGTYEITYTTPLASVPVLDVLLYPNGHPMQATITAEDETGVTVATYRTDTSANTDCDFSFTVHPA